ncbi:MAG: SDR family NAD(P)-dependent oxidoreductase [Rhodospirillaceae bacterium]|jgi:NAD(P)-dependent dehydrogenase (short-subunit alcohol dehydrogenase family)|nr:SDR family NAD(P)-dependent oxidoreductase [Rhodospirillaceae bacterium]MBT5244468.1 SDR family NAD(P)-dependent oxidoreductase [Rhodospirillaceae bacterium]MBT5560725.1 SDR family NAD(P)-dependent oxidoreductase [Rhodospirillaceae bacterium]MBT6242445.1 SDR family NAD(P)-dependent oxidoreductase [Rhodospirillaceae bacterium]MBT7136767.1 SDR family NAD(P)-dependent oxidoreductase [Rhodospirillaceae bacterium]
MNVTDMAALVTGAASGLGRATAEALARAGARVAFADLNLEAAKQAAEPFGENALALACDVSDAASAEAAVAAASEAHGPARILINCAGIGTPGKIVGRDGPMALDDFARVININLIGTFNMMRLAAAAMKDLEPLDTGERGVIINTASIAAYEGQIGQAAYAASKGGIVALTLPAAREFSRSAVRVLAIAPGIFGTPMLFGLSDDVQQALGASVPFPSRLGRPDEFADLVLHMLSNVMMNGEVVRLDGALRMAPL